jgi:hypothetical protein
MIREALVIQRRIFGSTTGDSLAMLAGILESQGKFDEALPLRRESLALRRAAFASVPHPALEQALIDLANTLGHLGQTDEATSLTKESQAIHDARTK